MDSDLRTFATGGGTAAEGLKIWDVRDLSKPTVKINWGETAMGEPINKCFNTVKFIPGMSMILGGVSDDIPAKCFNYKTGGAVIQDFHKLQRSCFTIDVCKDSSMVALGDFNGNIQVDNIVKAHL